MAFFGTLVACALSLSAIFFTFRFVTSRTASSVGKEWDELVSRISASSDKLDNLLTYIDSYCSRGQYESISGKLSGLKSELEKERTTLKDLEGRLDSSQQQVEEKETHQQEIKSSKEEDEIKLDELLSSYSDISAESIALEQKLAQSMKNLDSIMKEVTLTEPQRKLLDDLNEALNEAGSNLRDLLMEYETVNERLNMLKEQHDDLEEEYTKLVEQQLGE